MILMSETITATVQQDPDTELWQLIKFCIICIYFIVIVKWEEELKYDVQNVVKIQ